MEIPIYSLNELANTNDLNSNSSEFHDFLVELEEKRFIDDTKEKGILALAITKGTIVLSDKQLFVLQSLVKQYVGNECKICSEPIPLNEVLFYEDFQEGYCNYHWHQHQKGEI